MSKRRSTKYLVVHVTATRPSMDIGAAEVDRMHKNRGWSGIGYHYIIRRNGAVESGRAEGLVGAHVKGFNSVSLGVSMVGGVDNRGRPQDNATDAQYKSLETLLRRLSRKYPHAKVCGHRDLSPDRDGDGIIEPHEHMKACPCFDAIPWAKSHDLPAAAIRGRWSKGTTRAPRSPDKRKVYLQTLLRRAGYEFGAIDGLIGPKTKDAVRRFQRSAGIRVNGTFDKPTVARLRAMFEGGQQKQPVKTVTKTIVRTKTEIIAPMPVEASISNGNAAFALGIGSVVIAGISGLLDKIGEYLGVL